MFLTLSTVLASLLAIAGTVGSDPGTIPPDPSTVHDRLSRAPVDLRAAIAVAESVTAGHASAAEFLFDGNRVRVTVALEDGTNAVVTVSLDDGAVVEQEIAYRFPGEPVTGPWTETSTGLKYYDLEPGGGEAPGGPSARVEVHYEGWLLDGTAFDSSRDRGTPLVFGLDEVIAGWTEGVGSMRVGGRRKLILPAGLAYGERGVPGVIPPGATLVFDVELISLP